jgi:isopenicillin N synthase-like dioxygenase
MSAVPVLDIAPFRGGSPTEKAAVAARLDEICRDVGFLCLTGHGVPDDLFDDIYNVSKTFFRRDLSEKVRVAQPSRDIVRGYIGVGAAALADTMGEDTPPDWKESFSAGPVDVDPGDPYFTAPAARGHFEANVWPDTPAAFGDVWTVYYREMTRLAAEMMRLFAAALDLPEDFFADKIDRHISILGAMYYPEQTHPPEPGQLRAGAHTDFGTMTILRPDSAPGGLQIFTKVGTWEPVRAPEGAFVVNIGDMMARWTNDRWVSTLHRVVNPPVDVATGSERLSIGFFHEPNYDTMVSCLPSCQSPENPPKFEPILAGEHLYAQFSSQARDADAKAG